MKGQFQILFLPVILSALAGILVIGLGGTIFKNVAGGIAKLGLVALGIYAGFLVLERVRQQKSWDKNEIIILVVVLIILIYVMAGSNTSFSPIFKSIINP